MALIFKPDLAAKVMAGWKTVTRRMPSDNPRSPWWISECRYRTGTTSAVQPGRSKHSLGRVLVTSCLLVALGTLTEDEARREGFETADEFRDVWTAMHGGYNPAALVWRVEFSLIHPADPLWDESR